MNERFFELPSEKQDKMINAALKIFACNGYKHASTDDIVKEAQISKGLLFHYFISKEGLYRFLVEYSVRYLLNEYQYAIGEEKEYFAFHEKYEQAKLSVLRNYPYMAGFIEKAIHESNVSIREKSNDAINQYIETINGLRSDIVMPNIKSGVDMMHIENMIEFTIKGLTDKHMASDNPNPDALYEQIGDYMTVIKNLVCA